MMCGKQECAVQDVHSKAKGKSPLYVFHTRGFDIWYIEERMTQSVVQQSEHESGHAGIVFHFDTKAESGELIPCECDAIFCALHLICDIIRSVVCQILYPNMFLCHVLRVHKREGVIRFSENPHGAVNRFYRYRDICICPAVFPIRDGAAGRIHTNGTVWMCGTKNPWLILTDF